MRVIIINEKPYNVIETDTVDYLAHDIAYFCAFAKRPTKFVQHIDGDTQNDIWSNIQEE